MKASVFIGTSLDGFIARPNGDLDFLPPGGGEPHGYEEFMATVDALVIGRKTYETVLAFEQWAYGKKPVFVLSTRKLAQAPADAVVEHMVGRAGGDRREARSTWHRARLRGRRHHHPALPASRTHPAPDHHARSSAHWQRDSALRPSSV